MKNNFFKQGVFSIYLLLLSQISFAQAPHLMTFQAVIRDSSGALVTSTTVGIRASVIKDSATGTPVYVERQTPTTNAGGLASMMIGAGIVITGSFDSIHWGNGPFYLKIEIDITGGTSYSIIGAQQLVSVPYALYAANSGVGGIKPTVVTDSLNHITYTSVYAYGRVTSSGGEAILARGICIDTVPMPNIDRSFVDMGSFGGFTVYAYPLQPNKTYHLRAFATNCFGTGYGDTMSFTTLALTCPTLTLDSVFAITNISATGRARVTATGGSAITSYGVCWNTTGSPTISDSFANGTSSYSNFLSNLHGLASSTTYYVRAFAANSYGTCYSSEISFSTSSSIPVVIHTDTASSVTYSSATSGVNLISAGTITISAQGICIGRAINPTIDSPHYYTSTGLGDHLINISTLLPATTYHVRAFCTNGSGYWYGSDVSFTTDSILTPVVTTASVTAITSNSANSGGTVNDGGTVITARGVCWSHFGIPTKDSAHTVDGSGSGVFVSYITGLTILTGYHIRAYATNSSGTYYGALDSFTTDTLYSGPPSIPSVGTMEAHLSSATTANTGGYVLLDGGSTVTARGVCWSTSPMPTLSASHSTDGTGVGFFNSTLTGLTGCGTIYYVRAYATNAYGTGYGNQETVTTGLLPTVTTNVVTGVTDSTATSGGVIVSNGGCPIFHSGLIGIIRYDTSSWDIPVLYGSVCPFGAPYTNDGSDIGSFSSTLSGLYYNTTYKYRAYATNSRGTTYGAIYTFTTLPTTTTHYVGEFFAGGYIFYLDSTGNHGMVVNPDAGGYTGWGCPGTLLPGIDTAFGTGANNTAIIVASCLDTNTAAYQCANLTYAGYNDWFLPSYGELCRVTQLLDMGIFGVPVWDAEGYGHFLNNDLGSRILSSSQQDDDTEFTMPNCSDNWVFKNRGGPYWPVRRF